MSQAKALERLTCKRTTEVFTVNGGACYLEVTQTELQKKGYTVWALNIEDERKVYLGGPTQLKKLIKALNELLERQQ